MALQAGVVAPVEARLGYVVDVERVENGALLGVYSRKFQDLASPHPPHLDAIAKINGTRRPRGNERPLKTRLRKHQNLRIDIDAEVLQQRT